MSDIRAQLVEFFTEQGLAQGSELHGWRCSYPDVYGPCDCLEGVVDDLLASGLVLPFTKRERPVELVESPAQMERLLGAADPTRGSDRTAND